MQEILVAIKDVKAKEFTPGITHVRTIGMAHRNFLQILYEGRGTNFHRYPKDFMLYTLGMIDTETGEIHASTPVDITPHSEVDEWIRQQAKLKEQTNGTA